MDAAAAAPACATPGCRSPDYMVQKNGRCVKCNKSKFLSEAIDGAILRTGISARMANEEADGPEALERAVRLKITELTGRATILDSVDVRTSMFGVKEMLCAASDNSEDPDSFLLAFGTEALDDDAKTLGDYSIVNDANLQCNAQAATAARERRVRTLNVAALQHLRKLLGRICPLQLKLRKPNGSHKHRRWFVLTIAEEGTLCISWDKNKEVAAAEMRLAAARAANSVVQEAFDRSEAKCCTSSSVRVRARTVTGIVKTPSSNHLTINVTNGEPLRVATDALGNASSMVQRFLTGLIDAIDSSWITMLSDKTLQAIRGKSFESLLATDSSIEEVNTALAFHREQDLIIRARMGLALPPDLRISIPPHGRIHDGTARVANHGVGVSTGIARSPAHSVQPFDERDAETRKDDHGHQVRFDRHNGEKLDWTVCLSQFSFNVNDGVLVATAGYTYLTNSPPPYATNHMQHHTPCCVVAAVPNHFDVWNDTPGIEFLQSTEDAMETSPQQALELIRSLGGNAQAQNHDFPEAALLDQTARDALIQHIDAIGKENTDLILALTQDELESLIGVAHVSHLISFFGAQPNEFRMRRVVVGNTARCVKFHTDFSRRTMQVPLNSETEYDGGHLVFATEEGLAVFSRALGSATIHSAGSVHGVTKLRSGVRYSLFLAMMPGGGEDVDLQHLVVPACDQVSFFERALPFLRDVTNEQLLTHVHAYHEFLVGRAHDEQLQPSFEVEVVWRAHLLSPIAYATDCATILGCDEPTVLAHLPLPVSEYTDSPDAVAKSQSQSPHASSMSMHWYQDLAVKTRRGRKFMEHILSLRELSKSMLTEEVGNYIQFLRDVSTADLEEDVEMRVPGLLVDLVWHTHQFFPQLYSEDCVRIGGRVFDHVQDSDDEDGSRDSDQRCSWQATWLQQIN